MFEIRKALLTPGTGLYDNFYFGWIVPLMLTLKRQWNEKALGIKYTLTACNNTAQKCSAQDWMYCDLIAHFLFCVMQISGSQLVPGHRFFTMDINWWPTNSPQIVYRAKVNKKVIGYYGFQKWGHVMQPVHAGQMNLVYRAKTLCFDWMQGFEINKRTICFSCLKFNKPIYFITLNTQVNVLLSMLSFALIKTHLIKPCGILVLIHHSFLSFTMSLRVNVKVVQCR